MKIFRLWQSRQDWMIERLFETSQPSRRAACIDQRRGDHSFENLRADMMGTGESREQPVRRKHFEGANVQLLVAAQCVVQSASAFRERRWIQDDQLEVLVRLFRATKKLKNILLNPAHRQVLAPRLA